MRVLGRSTCRAFSIQSIRRKPPESSIHTGRCHHFATALTAPSPGPDPTALSLPVPLQSSLTTPRHPANNHILRPAQITRSRVFLQAGTCGILDVILACGLSRRYPEGESDIRRERHSDLKGRSAPTPARVPTPAGARAARARASAPRSRAGHAPCTSSAGTTLLETAGLPRPRASDRFLCHR